MSANDRSASSCHSPTSRCRWATSSVDRLVCSVSRSNSVATRVRVPQPHALLVDPRALPVDPPAPADSPPMYSTAPTAEPLTGSPAGPRPGTGPLARLRTLAEQRHAAGLHRELRPRPAGGDGLLDLAGNDYLGLS